MLVILASLDAVLMGFCTNEFRTAGFVIGTAIARLQINLDILLWRLRELVRSGKLECEGKMTALRDFKVKLMA